MELHSSDELLRPSDTALHTLRNPEESQNPKSSDLGFNTSPPQSSPTDHRASLLMDDEELKHRDEQRQKQLNEGFGYRFDSENAPDEDGELRKSMDELIHQVIYREALHEAVMNLALDERNAIQGEVVLRDSINEEISHSDEAEDGKMISGLGEGNNNNTLNEINEKEGVNEIKNGKISEVNWEISEVSWEDSDVKGKSGDVDENEGQNRKEGGESEDEENYGTEEGENDGDHMGSNEDGRDDGGRNYGRRVMYPVRPDAEDCAYYMKTRSCKFGANCKFNHPPRRRNQGVNKEKAWPKAEESEWPVQTECKYYLTSGGCKFGKACKYSHSRERRVVAPVAPIMEFNFLGLPIRRGEKECPYYMRNGSCKYGSNCRFNHPDPTSVAGTDPAPGYRNGGSVPLQGVAPSPAASWSSMPVMFPPTQAPTPANPDWNGYQAPAYPTSERSLPTPPAFAMNNPANETNFYSQHQHPMPVDEYPERPGQPECSYFLKTGDCKYKSNCRYHHPKIRLSKSTPCALSEKGLPLRPDQSICSYYSRYGICKFGPACKFDHPENWGNTSPSDGAGTVRQEMEAGLS